MPRYVYAAMDALHHLLVIFGVLVLAQAALIVVLIVSHRRRLRSMLAARRHYADFTHAARLSVVGELTAAIVHEVTQPLSAILSNVETAELLLQAPNPKLAPILDILTDVRHDDLRAYDLVRGLRSLLRKRELKLEPVDINRLVTDVLRLMQPDAVRRGVVIEAALAAELPLSNADPVHVQQVLINLVLNAMEAMRDTPKADRFVEVRTRLQGDGTVRVEVSDNGRGVSPKVGDKVFDPFFTTKGEGMGLGLALARSIVTLHGGSLWFENRSHGGAVFMFTLTASKCKRQDVAVPPTIRVSGHAR
jgi:C4-dicarboxylate-specific signal transduction histidine kinase